jgi:hypothetical protein
MSLNIATPSATPGAEPRIWCFFCSVCRSTGAVDSIDFAMAAARSVLIATSSAARSALTASLCWSMRRFSERIFASAARSTVGGSPAVAAGISASDSGTRVCSLSLANAGGSLPA